MDSGLTLTSGQPCEHRGNGHELISFERRETGRMQNCGLQNFRGKLPIAIPNEQGGAGGRKTRFYKFRGKLPIAMSYRDGAGRGRQTMSARTNRKPVRPGRRSAGRHNRADAGTGRPPILPRKHLLPRRGHESIVLLGRPSWPTLLLQRKMAQRKIGGESQKNELTEKCGKGGLREGNRGTGGGRGFRNTNEH